jgi:hypothetical protein
MVRKINAKYIVSDDMDFEEYTEEVILLAPDIVVEKYYRGWNLINIASVSDNQETVVIDRAKSPMLYFPIETDCDVDFKFLATATLPELVRKFAQ